jgi:hypothetical protein
LPEAGTRREVRAGLKDGSDAVKAGRAREERMREMTVTGGSITSH